MSSRVYFIDLHTDLGKSIFHKLGELLKRNRIDGFIQEGDLIGIKIHFGEEGSTSFIHPRFAGFVAEEIKKRGGNPFLTDTNAVYTPSCRGSRANSISHLKTAFANGFTFSTIGAPVIISGGIRSRNSIKVEVEEKHCRFVEVTPEVEEIDKLISLNHFKGHADTSFGGAIKNIGVGLVNNPAKFWMHTTAKPFIDEEKCDRCGICQRRCPVGAIQEKDKSLFIDSRSCIGCADCIADCPRSAIDAEWNEPKDVVQEKMCEYAYAITQKKPVFHINFLLNISPECDCHPWTNPSMVPDIGILASFDPVAIDQASVDLVNQQGGEDKFRGIYPDIDWSTQLSYGEGIGLGTRNYELVKVEL